MDGYGSQCSYDLSRLYQTPTCLQNRGGHPTTPEILTAGYCHMKESGGTGLTSSEIITSLKLSTNLVLFYNE